MLEQQLAELKKGMAQVNNQIAFNWQVVHCEDDERPPVR